MAVTQLGQVGVGSATTAGTTVSFTNDTGAVIPAGTLIKINYGCDNIASVTAPTLTPSTVGGATPVAGHAAPVGSGVTTSAGAGIWHQCWRVLTTSSIAAGATVCTITSNQSAVKRAIVGLHYSGVTATLRGTVVSATSTAGTPSAVSGGTAPATDDLVIGCIVGENNAVTAGDSDSLNGNWSAAPGVGVATSGGAANTNVMVCIQDKVVTAGGAQTYNPTTANDSIACIEALVPALVPVQAAASLTAVATISVNGVRNRVATASLAVIATIATRAVSHAPTVLLPEGDKLVLDWNNTGDPGFLWDDLDDGVSGETGSEIFTGVVGAIYQSWLSAVPGSDASAIDLHMAWTWDDVDSQVSISLWHDNLAGTTTEIVTAPLSTLTSLPVALTGPQIALYNSKRASGRFFIQLDVGDITTGQVQVQSVHVALTLGAPAVTAAASLAAVATISTAAFRTAPAAASLSAVATITTAAAQTATAAASVAVVATITTAGVGTRPADASLTAVATISTAAFRTAPSQASLAVVATIVTTADRTAIVSSSLTINATIATSAIRTAPSDSSLAVVATITTAALRTGFVDTSLAVVATISTAAFRTAFATSSLTAVATITTTATASAFTVATSSLSITATISSTASLQATSAASLSVTATIGTAVLRTAPATASLAVVATIATAAQTTVVVGANLTVVATISTAAIIQGQVNVQSSLTAVVTIATAATGTRPSASTLAVTATITTAAVPTHPAAASLAVVATIITAALRAAAVSASVPAVVTITTSELLTVLSQASLPVVATILIGAAVAIFSALPEQELGGTGAAAAFGGSVVVTDPISGANLPDALTGQVSSSTEFEGSVT